MKYMIKKAIVAAIATLILPTSVAIAEPSAGMLGSQAVTNAASTVAAVQVYRPRTEQIMATITAYASREAETDDTPFISADGNEVYDGLIACSRAFSFGTEFIVAGRTYRCGDRMAEKNDAMINFALKREKLDIWMSSVAASDNWGVRVLPVTIVYN